MAQTRLPCTVLKTDLPHSHELTLGPFRFSSEHLRKLSTGMFFLGEVDEMIAQESIKHAFSHKIYWHTFVELLKRLSCKKYGRHPVLHKIMFRFIPKSGHTYRDLLDAYDESTPMDFDYDKLWGFEIFVLLANCSHDHAWVGGLVKDIFEEILSRSNRVVNGIVYTEVDGSNGVGDDEEEAAGRQKKKKQRTAKISKFEQDLGDTIRRHVFNIRDGRPLTMTVNSSKSNGNVFRLSGPTQCWSYCLHSAKDLMTHIGDCSRQDFENYVLREALHSDDDSDIDEDDEDDHEPIDAFELLSMTKARTSIRDYYLKTPPGSEELECDEEEYMNANSNGDVVFKGINGQEDTYIVWLSVKMEDSLPSRLTSMLCPFFYTYDSQHAEEIPFYLKPQQRELSLHGQMNRWSWPDRYRKYMLENPRDHKIPPRGTGVDELVYIGEFEDNQCSTFRTKSSEIDVEATVIDNVMVWQWCDNHNLKTDETSSEYVHQLWKFKNKLIFKTFHKKHQKDVSHKFRPKPSVVPVAEFPVVKDDDHRVYVQSKRTTREELILKSLRSNFNVAWHSASGMSHSFQTATKEMTARAREAGRDIECPWFINQADPDEIGRAHV